MHAFDSAGVPAVLPETGWKTRVKFCGLRSAEKEKALETRAFL
jgi:hypothetical protein